MEEIHNIHQLGIHVADVLKTESFMLVKIFNGRCDFYYKISNDVKTVLSAYLLAKIEFESFNNHNTKLKF